MGNIQRREVNGSIERFGMSSALEDRMSSLFADRGRQAAQLVVASLTETRHAPTIKGVQYGIEVSNIHMDSEEDMVETAREALHEAINARTKGMKRGNLLDSFATRYMKFYNSLAPGMRDSKSHVASFEESFVAHANELEVPILDPATGKQILQRAPRRISGMFISYATPAYSGDIKKNKLLTTDGHMVTLETHKRTSGSTYSLMSVGDLCYRGGRAPGSGIVSDIKREVICRRTEHQKRP